MRRRDFIVMFGGSAVARPSLVHAQQPTVPVIGFLHPGSAPQVPMHIAAFHQGLGEAGYVEGRNVAIEYRWAEGHYERLPALAADLVRRQVAVISANGGLISAQTAKAATTTIPIVFGIDDDPVTRGLVASLSHPGGNMTGISTFGVSLGPKRLELLRQLLPNAIVICVLLNPANPVANSLLEDTRGAARTSGIDIQALNASTDDELEAALTGRTDRKCDALVLLGDPFFYDHKDRIIGLAAQHALPVIYPERDYVDAGGLISYGNSLPDRYRLAAHYVGKVLDGVKPADLPIMRTSRFEMAVNLKTAKPLGLAVSQAVLASADDVIE
jgi:putative ABC transport system substrate-binding protein